MFQTITETLMESLMLLENPLRSEIKQVYC